MDKVTVRLIDMSSLEGNSPAARNEGLGLNDVKRSIDGESGYVHVGKRVLVPWSSILYYVIEE